MTQKSDYFKDLNYSLANEDTRLELAMCERLRPRRVLSICGSGGRCLPLAAAAPEVIVALDLAQQQLHLAQLRAATMRQLTFEEFLIFWGFPPYSVGIMTRERRHLFARLDLGREAHLYCKELLDRHSWHGLIYAGKWEKTIIGIPRLLKRLAGDQYDEIFGFTSLDAQHAYFTEKLASKLWKRWPRLVLRLFGNAAFFNAFLYKGHFVKKNIEEDYFEFYRQTFRRLFANGLTRENFFLQLCFLGTLRFPEGNPVEAQSDVFAKVKAALSAGTKVEYHAQDLLSFARQTSDRFDFVSLSDVPSYFDAATQRDYLTILSRCLNPGAVCVVRCYLRVPERTVQRDFVDVTSDYTAEIAAEKVQMYKTIVYRYEPSTAKGDPAQ